MTRPFNLLCLAWGKERTLVSNAMGRELERPQAGTCYWLLVAGLTGLTSNIEAFVYLA